MFFLAKTRISAINTFIYQYFSLVMFLNQKKLERTFLKLQQIALKFS